MAHILVVEDDKTNAKLFEMILRRIGGFDVTVSEDATTVLELASSGNIDLILMDVSLSNTSYQGAAVDGLDLTRILKAEDATRHLPVILTTAHALRGDRERFLEQCGADDYVSKPVEDNHAMVAQISAILASSRRHVA